MLRIFWRFFDIIDWETSMCLFRNYSEFNWQQFCSRSRSLTSNLKLCWWFNIKIWIYFYYVIFSTIFSSWCSKSRWLILKTKSSERDREFVYFNFSISKTNSLCSKSYTFNVNDNFAFCIISHFIELAFHDNVFVAFDLTFSKLLFSFQLFNDKCTSIFWKKKKFTTSIFRRIVESENDVHVFAHENLFYHKYQNWVKRFDENLNYLDKFTIYCLRKATNNAINDKLFWNSTVFVKLIELSNDSNFNVVVRNFVMNHINFVIFERNYLSRQIRYDNQIVYFDRDFKNLFIQIANRMSRLQNSHRFKKFNDQQKEQMR